MASNYGFRHMPRIVQYAGGVRARNTVLMPIKNSAAIYLGGFVPLITGTAAAPQGAEFGVPAFTDDALIYGFVKKFQRPLSLVPIWDDALKKGTVTDATGELPVKYTASASNDGSNATPDGELAEIMPILPGDILEIALWGASTISVARGTTTATGTTGSSGNFGVGMSVNTTYHFAVTESTAAKALANLDFITIMWNGKQPKDPNHVYVQCVRSGITAVVAE